MKVIDLLNKIANGEEVPEKIKYKNAIFTIREDKDDYVCENGWFTDSYDYLELNDEVEIIEEPQEHKIPEKLEFGRSIENGKEILTVPSEKMIIIKINEIIDYLEENND